MTQEKHLTFEYEERKNEKEVMRERAGKERGRGILRGERRYG